MINIVTLILGRADASLVGRDHDVIVAKGDMFLYPYSSNVCFLGVEESSGYFQIFYQINCELGKAYTIPGKRCLGKMTELTELILIDDVLARFISVMLDPRKIDNFPVCVKQLVEIPADAHVKLHPGLFGSGFMGEIDGQPANPVVIASLFARS